MLPPLRNGSVQSSIARVGRRTCLASGNRRPSASEGATISYQNLPRRSETTRKPLLSAMAESVRLLK